MHDDVTPPGTGTSLPPVPEWLDEVEGPQALAWARSLTRKAEAAYATAPGFIDLAADIEAILDSPGRVPAVAERAGMLYNFWTDASNPRGLWRRTTWLDYACEAPGPGTEHATGAGSALGSSDTTAPEPQAAPAAAPGPDTTPGPGAAPNLGTPPAPDPGTATGASPTASPAQATSTGPASALPHRTRWETLLDLDALSQQEGRAWVWHGAQVLRRGPRAGTRALVTLSDGGSDADTTRELDLGTRRLVPPEEGGFLRPTSKGSMSWADEDGQCVLVTTDLGEGSLTRSGYPRQALRLHRGQARQDPHQGQPPAHHSLDLEGAEVLGTCAADAVGVFVSRDEWGRTWLTVAQDFYTTRTWLLPDDLEVPRGPQASAQALAHDGELVPEGALRLEVPESAVAGVARQWLTVELREPWEVAGTTYPAGSLLAAPLEDYLAGSREMTVLFSPSPRTSLAGTCWTRSHLVLTVLDDVVTRLEALTPPAVPSPAGPGPGQQTPEGQAAGTAPRRGCAGDSASNTASDSAGDTAASTAVGPAPGRWERHDLDLTGLRGVLPSPSRDSTDLRPGRGLVTLSAHPVDARDTDYLWVSLSGWTTPPRLAVARLAPDGRLTGTTVLRQAPARYDASAVVVTQHTAVSADGTRIPYFQIGRPAPGTGTASPTATTHPGSTTGTGPGEPGGSGTAGGPGGQQPPTLLYGYGGFEHSLLPRYQPVVGRAWLERGGTYVVANIRGGGEYGPGWHQAALRERRERAFEDFAAVARSLVERGVTTPRRLAVHGGSNGGLLAGVMLTRYPELVGAVVCEVPLLDMQRYTHLLAGHSWVAEYGDPEDPQQWEHIRRYSPLHQLEAGRSYPPALLVTSTRDDRVHPAHARSMAFRMLQMGQPVTYFENSEGGHGAASTNAQRAVMSALVYEFCWHNLT